MSKLIFKSPTLEILTLCDIKKGCLIPLNQGSLFFVKDLEQLSLEYGVITQADLKRKEDIETRMKSGFGYDIKDDNKIPESVINNCYNIITSGYCLIDVTKPFICELNYEYSVNEEEQSLLSELHEIKAKQLYFYEYSYESIIERISNYYLLKNCILYPNFEPVFKDIKDVMNFDASIVADIVIRFIEFRNYIPEPIFRIIARGDCEAGRKWLSRWLSLKSANSTIFDSWDENKITLARWTDKYESIRGSYEPPSEEIINNDSALDAWLHDKRLEKELKQSMVSTDAGVLTKKNQEFSYVAPGAMSFESGG